MCILIATKDRTVLLEKTLDSITHSSILPGKVVIVYHGADVSKITNKFKKILNIKVIHSDIANQSIQKFIGIQYISQKFEWVLFADDDLILKFDTLEYLMRNYVSNVNLGEFAGFGLNIVNDKQFKLSRVAKTLLFIFSLYSKKPGSITRSGHAQAYMNQENDTEVEWLNGISLWNSKFLNFYTPTSSQSIYSAYEDVCFSHQVSKHKKLLFVNKAHVYHQHVIEHRKFTFQQFFSGGYHRYYFVTTNNLSKNWFLFAQVLRNIDFIFQYQNFSELIHRVVLAKKLWFILFSLSRRNIHGKNIWNEKLFIPN